MAGEAVPGLRESASSARQLAIGTSRADMARMPLAGGPQLGFPPPFFPALRSSHELPQRPSPAKQFLRNELRAGMREWQESVLDSLMGNDYR